MWLSTVLYTPRETTQHKESIHHPANTTVYLRTITASHPSSNANQSVFTHQPSIMQLLSSNLLLFASIASSTAGHRQRKHIGIRGVPSTNSVPSRAPVTTFHPTRPAYNDESSSFPTNSPTYNVMPTATPTSDSYIYSNFPTSTPTAFSDSENAKCSGQHLKLDINTDFYACETSWTLERIHTGGTRETVKEGSGYLDEFVYDDVAKLCLEAGEYEFNIYGTFHASIHRSVVFLHG